MMSAGSFTIISFSGVGANDAAQCYVVSHQKHELNPASRYKYFHAGDAHDEVAAGPGQSNVLHNTCMDNKRSSGRSGV